MPQTLQLILVLLGAAVVVVVICRLFRLPPILGYLMVGIAVGPHALAWVPDTENVRDLAEFGIVFLMFSIGLEFSLPQLKSMRRAVFGLGLAQVAITTIAAMIALHFVGWGWQAGFALGGALAMSSTAIVSKMLAERMELATPHGRDIMGILLFQDLAVVAFLIVLPSLGKGGGELARDARARRAQGRRRAGADPLRRAEADARVVPPRRAAARPELFMLNLLLITLGLAALTELAGLSLALGAFLAGMLIAETEYRYQVEEDIKPFRDVLLGLFFVTVGMALDLALVVAHWGWVLLLLIIPVVVKLVLIVALSRLFGAPFGTALRTGFYLAQAGEFALVMLAVAADEKILAPPVDPARAGGDGAVDAGRAARHPLRRADRAQVHRQRLARARGADHADRGDHDGAAGPRDHLRLRAQRPEPRPAARARGHRVHRARLRSAARARGGRARAAASSTATPGARKRCSPPGS